MNFVETCVKDSLPVWKECLESEFLRKMADGSLEEECFKGYIVDDSLYLREYARVFAWGILGAENMEEIRAYYSLLSFVNESEDSTRRYYLERYGLEDADIQRLPLRPQNRAYVEEMHRAAGNSRQAPECMMASLPCMLSYGWIFKEMLKRDPQVKDTVYGRFVSDYAGKDYERLCREWTDFAEKVCGGLSEERKRRCLSIFRACSEHEKHFWEMSAVPREDI
ncbi:TENA/THI-4 family protein [Lachnoclostridium sp. An138]|uniref:TENA/THI-4 family protein n=1 Tax=Lachnoclostridium sp. An138 TaxID=1965560 RepID=UPI000B37FFF2|nr:TENA/THI-4 family protein [Lachnoclostridium sp. An138]OUQ17347.1 TENA/THI-4 family protein [Lachnoclostridium sp. An138]